MVFESENTTFNILDRLQKLEEAVQALQASQVSLNAENLDGVLSGTDTDLQTALETIDDHTH